MPVKTCCIVGCEGKYLAHGYCSKHYQRELYYKNNKPKYAKRNKQIYESTIKREKV